MHKNGKRLDEIFNWSENRELLYDKVSELVPEDELDDDEKWTQQLREFLNNKANWSDDQIWRALIEICDEKILEVSDGPGKKYV